LVHKLSSPCLRDTGTLS